MALFPLSFVLSPRRRLYEPEAAGLCLRRTKCTPRQKPLPAIASHSGEAGGLVRPCSEKRLLTSGWKLISFVGGVREIR